MRKDKIRNKYDNFGELNRGEKRGKDFDIEKKSRSFDFAVIAIHGGEIETGTTEIAEAIARNDLSFYSFIGKNRHPFRDLRISSDSFDEPECYGLIKKCQKVISIHGEKSKTAEFVMLGGLDKELQDKIGRVLENAGFLLEETSAHLKGEGLTNVCNLGISGAGVQLEISRKLRDRLKSDDDLMEKFSDTIRGAFSDGPK